MTVYLVYSVTEWFFSNEEEMKVEAVFDAETKAQKFMESHKDAKGWFNCRSYFYKEMEVK